MFTSPEKIFTFIANEDDYDNLFESVYEFFKEELIVELIQRYVAEPIQSRWENDVFIISFKGETYRITLHKTPHDMFIVLSSFYEILKSTYTIWLMKKTFETDDIEILITNNHCAEQLRNEHATWVEENLVVFQPGFDVIYKMKVPYLHHEDIYPQFLVEAQALSDKNCNRAVTEIQSYMESSATFKELLKAKRNAAQHSPNNLAPLLSHAAPGQQGNSNKSIIYMGIAIATCLFAYYLFSNQLKALF